MIIRPFDDLTASPDEPKSARSEHRTVLDAADWDVFLAALENPPPPSDKLREALRLHDRRVVRDNVGPEK